MMMTHTMHRVTSRDGTQIAYWKSGQGPPLVLVHGATVDHTNWQALLPYLEPHVTVHAMDRRGRGGSGDVPDHDVAREFEDVAAVVDAVAQNGGSAVDVLGHSYGGECALGAAALTASICRLVLYEGWPSPDREVLDWYRKVAQQLQPLLLAGDREEALEAFYRQIVNVSDEELVAVKAHPTWRARVAAVHTSIRELRAGTIFDPERAARITVPVLMLVGGDTPDALRHEPETVAAALPDARLEVLEGQQHIAHRRAPDLFARRVLAFLHDEGEPLRARSGSTSASTVVKL